MIKNLIELKNVSKKFKDKNEEIIILKDVLDKNLKIIKTNRGGKITWHGPGQLICYFVINISKRKKDIRKFITAIENSIIKTLKDFKISSFSDRKNIGIWVLDKKEEKNPSFAFREYLHLSIGNSLT